MYSKLFKNGVNYGFLSIPTLFNQDIIKNETETEKSADRSDVVQETGLERLKRTFTPE